MKIVRVAALVGMAVLLAGCGGATNQNSSNATPTSAQPAASSSSSEPTEDPVVDPTPTESESEGGYTTSKFGTTSGFTQGDGATFTVMVGKPVKAKCQYSYSSCSKPETGDRMITSKVVISNTSKDPIEVSSSLFVLEFPDGTRMEPGDGSALEYQPDNAMDYGHKIRPGGKYSSTLTFEAPTGAFTIIMLTNSYDGEDLHGWN
jgi:hypothetical protein